MILIGIGLLFSPYLLSATTYGPYYAYVDTALYKDSTFHLTLTSTAVDLFGSIHNFQQLGGVSRKVASIDFALTNGYSGITYDLLVDSIHVFVERYNDELMQWQTYSFCKMKLELAHIYNKTCRKYKVELDYSHTNNGDQRRYRVNFTIYGSYE
ncbi:hypothetical protein A2Y85_06120 [candidate division WOR-3 bacterium RBG_13_43_14]|uniref:Uncharacterized protein n=1 Tax=candidate division WOR-3 bacterium RBG_13_43_14 TaxID=1802590 RepID=A0A1F4U2H4_UNCW3|nr:MAG: hypothetical protein A2Y85_06120 [candidate division WOR-3 bacterium RBG_13_43_14]